MDIFLGTITNDHQISIKDRISEEQYARLNASINEIGNLESNRRLFEIVVLNKKDFIDALNTHSREMIASSMKIQGDKPKYDRHYLNFNRLFLNYLSSLKTFIDHNSTVVTRIFGSGSKELTEYKKMTSHYFDNFFCYRFFLSLGIMHSTAVFR